MVSSSSQVLQNASQDMECIRTSQVIICLYVNDMLITCVDESEVKGVKLKLMQELEMSNLGNSSYFLGMKFKDTS